MQDFGIKDAIDIFLVALLLYNMFKLMKESGNINIFTGILSFIGVWIVVTQILDMKLMGAIMDKIISVGMVVLVILFQDEIRRFLVELGSHKRWRFFLKHFTPQKDTSSEKNYIVPLTLACVNMSKKKVGALIVLQGDITLTHIERSGEIINADISTRLIENIFFKNSPLHDGAMIIANSRIVAAGCILPVAHDHNIPKELGLRHRAALGISQESDAKAIVISEETGNISVAYKGKLHIKLSPKELENLISETDIPK